MPTPTYIPLSTITLGSAASSVTFGSIPQTYRDLVLVIGAATSNNSNNIMRFNADSGSNYSYVFMTGNGSSATSGAESTTFLGTDSSAFTTTVLGETNQIVNLMDYSATDKHKTTLVRANRAGGAVDAVAGRWANTAAITTILLRPNNGSFTWSVGSTFSLYGIKA